MLNTSINAHIGMPASSVYAATKAGLRRWRARCRAGVVGRGIRVDVSPGPVATPLYGKLGLSAVDLDKTAQSVPSQVPAGRFGDPAEIVKAVVFLASDEAPFTVGAELIIDGGMGL